MAWRLRVLAGHLYGQKFQDEMTACAYSTLETSGIPEVEIPISEMQTSFRLLDEVLAVFVKDGAPVYNGVEVPFAYMAGFRLLTSTEGLSSAAENVRGDLELATALATLGDQTAEILPALLKGSAET